jgi:Protein of unknown function (DUF3467)
MAATNQPAAIVAAQLPRARDAQFREVYANMSQTQLGPFDITLLFQKGMEITPGQMAAVDQVAVVLAPQHFKALVRSLTETLSAYETVFGILQIPETDITPQKNAAEITKAIEDLRAKALAFNAKEGTNLSSTAPPQPGKQSHVASRKKARQP